MYLHDLIEQQSPKIIFLQEIWLAASDTQILKEDFPQYNFLVATPDMFEHTEDVILNPNYVWHGAAVAWHTDLHYAVTELATPHSRFAAILFDFSNTTKILAISLYAPTSGKDEEFLECLDFLEQFVVENSPPNGSVLLGADSNCSEKSKENMPGQNSVKSCHLRSQNLIYQHFITTMAPQNHP